MSHYILVHGAWEESGMWDNVLPILRRSGHTVTAVDLPGYGVNRNSVSLVTSKVYLDALLEVINKADRRRRHGRVYRARDTTLDRDVAIKVLPDAFASDPDRLARFEREGQGAGVAEPSQHREETSARRYGGRTDSDQGSDESVGPGAEAELEASRQKKTANATSSARANHSAAAPAHS